MVSFVDNWTLLAQSVPESERLLRETKLASDGLGLILNPDKTRAFAVAATDGTLLKKVSFEGHKLEVCHSTADLGVLFTTSHRPTSQSLQKRLQSNAGKFARLPALPWSATRKQEVLQRAIGPSVLYGAELASTSISPLCHKFEQNLLQSFGVNTITAIITWLRFSVFGGYMNISWTFLFSVSKLCVGRRQWTMIQRKDDGIWP